jgi:hypothetical protein
LSSVKLLGNKPGLSEKASFKGGQGRPEHPEKRENDDNYQEGQNGIRNGHSQLILAAA